MRPLHIDLHMHSTVSDGTDAPAEILARAREARFTHFALTDHDAIAGCVAIRDLLQEGDPTFICGAEFSCEDEFGKYHVLGYGYDLQAESILTLAKDCHDYRINKVIRRLDFLRQTYGIDFAKEDVDELLAMSNPGKPHIANLMIKYGLASSIDDAFRRFLNGYRAQDKRIRPECAIEAILRSDGIPVLAHPSYGSGDELIVGEDMVRRLTRLMDFGLKGVEAFYSGFSRALQGELLSLAARYDLYVTAGSDYHGTNKIVQLGDTNLDEAADVPNGLLRFLQDVKKY